MHAHDSINVDTLPYLVSTLASEDTRSGLHSAPLPECRQKLHSKHASQKQIWNNLPTGPVKSPHGTSLMPKKSKKQYYVLSSGGCRSLFLNAGPCRLHDADK
jgi:hypothetical protein